MNVQDCTHCGDWRTILRNHFPPDVLWDPGTKLRLTGLCTGMGTQQATLPAPKLSFPPKIIVFTCFQIMFMSNV